MFKHKWLAAVFLVAGSLFGDCGGCSEPCGMDCGCDTCCDSCNFCCSTPCCCEPCDFCPPEPPETCAYNAPKFLDIKCTWDMFLTGSFVYMQAKEENLEFAQTLSSLRGFQENVVNDTQTLNYSSLSFDYEPAFKVGIGFTLGCDNWDFYTEYFRYHADVAKGNTSVTADEDRIIDVATYFMPLATGKNLPTLLSCSSFEADSKWRLEMDIVDFNLRRKYFVGRCLIMQTAVGIQAAWINQKQTTNYNCTLLDADTGELSATDSSNVVNSSCSWAVGAKAALDTEWMFCGSFRLIGNTSVAILYTDYDSIKNKTTYTGFVAAQDPSPSSTINLDTSYSRSLCFLRPNANISLGLGWGDYWCCNDWYFDVTAAYEFRCYWNQNVLPQVNIGAFNPSGLYGDLYLHGLVITARLDF